MQQRLHCFLVVLLLIFSGNVFSQAKDSTVPRTLLSMPFLTAAHATESIRLTSIAPDFYSSHLGFFCKKEWQVEKYTSIPFRFRLGSLEYTNSLEHSKVREFIPKK